MFDSERTSAPTEDPAVAEVISEMRERSVDEMTPLDALNQLAAWKRRLKKATQDEPTS